MHKGLKTENIMNWDYISIQSLFAIGSIGPILLLYIYWKVWHSWHWLFQIEASVKIGKMTEVWLGFTFFIKWQTYDKVCQGVASQTKNVYSFTPKKKMVNYIFTKKYGKSFIYKYIYLLPIKWLYNNLTHQSEASWIPRSPVAAIAFSLQINMKGYYSVAYFYL